MININENILFGDVTMETLLYTHKEDKYIDFKREPLLPYKLSEEGPPIAVGDINGDKIPDLYIEVQKQKGKNILGMKQEFTFQRKTILLKMIPLMKMWMLCF